MQKVGDHSWDPGWGSAFQVRVIKISGFGCIKNCGRARSLGQLKAQQVMAGCEGAAEGRWDNTPHMSLHEELPQCHDLYKTLHLTNGFIFQENW